MLKYNLRASITTALVLGVSTLAGAQYTAPRGGYSSAGPAVAGAAGGAAAIGGLLYWKHHYRAKVQGCVSGDGDKLVSEQDKQTYSLDNKQAKSLKPGERVELLGTKRKTEAGEPTFEVRKLGKDFGSCSATTAEAR